MVNNKESPIANYRPALGLWWYFNQNSQTVENMQPSKVKRLWNHQEIAIKINSYNLCEIVAKFYLNLEETTLTTSHEL